MYTQISIVQLRGMEFLLDSDSTVSKAKVHMTGLFLDIKYFLIFPQAGLFINMPALVTIAWLVTFCCLNISSFLCQVVQLFVIICKHSSSDFDQQITT